MKKILTALLLCFIMVFSCFMLCACDSVDGTWEIFKYEITIDNQTFSFSKSEAENLVVTKTKGFETIEEEVAFYISSTHNLYKTMTVRFSGEKLFLARNGEEEEHSWRRENNIIQIKFSYNEDYEDMFIEDKEQKCLIAETKKDNKTLRMYFQK